MQLPRLYGYRESGYQGPRTVPIYPLFEEIGQFWNGFKNTAL